LTARVTILNNNNNNGNNLTSGSNNLKMDQSELGNNNDISSVNAMNGDFNIKHKFLNGGMYQVIVRVNSDKYALALASFEIYVI
jgi:hypothetical protein